MADSKTQILIVDDDPVFSQVLQRALVRRGHDVQVAHTMQDAMSLVRKYPFKKAIVDLKLEQGSGLLLIREMKDHRQDLDMIILTGYSSISTAVEAIKSGALNYLCKPADTEEILIALGLSNGHIHSDIPLNPPSIDRLEWEHIQRVLLEHGGNISATARALGMHRRTLQRKLQKRPVKQ